MRRVLFAVLAVAVSAVAAEAQSAAPSHDIARAGWIAGCWELRAGPRVTQEQWMAPAGGAMVGMSRMVIGDALRDWEFVLLGPSPAGLAYQVTPSRQSPTSFPATVVTDTLLVFENAANDFPQRIIYRRVGADSLRARIEGSMGGQQRAVDFPYARVACPTGR